MRSRLRREDGWAMATAMVVMALMAGAALFAFDFVGGQQREARVERVMESSFNLAEGALNVQTYVIANNWPGGSGNAYPSECNASTSADARCPSDAQLKAIFSNVDQLAATAWRTQVRDNGAPYGAFYNDNVLTTQPTYDANNDDEVWVRAEATVRGRTRKMVARVRVDEQKIDFPLNVLLAGKFATTNSGNKVIVDSIGTASQAAPLTVRCGKLDAGCLLADLLKGQIVPPDSIVYGAENVPAISRGALGRLRNTAKALGTYYTNCPPKPQGALVFIENGDCSYNNSSMPCCNTASAPGITVLANGSLELGGNITYYGVIYAANLSNRTDYLVETQGTALIQGAVAVDGFGGFLAGSSKENVIFDPRAINNMSAFISAGIVQNTWREL